MIFTANQHIFAPELPAEKSMARVLLLTAIFLLLAVRKYSQSLARVLPLTANYADFLSSKIEH